MKVAPRFWINPATTGKRRRVRNKRRSNVIRTCMSAVAAYILAEAHEYMPRLLLVDEGEVGYTVVGVVHVQVGQANAAVQHGAVHRVDVDHAATGETAG